MKDFRTRNTKKYEVLILDVVIEVMWKKSDVYGRSSSLDESEGVLI